MGWLGWTQEQAMRADVNAIEIAMEGRIDMLRTVWGSKKEKKPPVPTRWGDFVKTHNEIIRRG